MLIKKISVTEINRETYWKPYGQEKMMGINHKKKQYLNSVWVITL